jgi:dihydropteroate synthase
MHRKIFYWKLRTTELQLGERTLIMGVLNITPDSFSDGGRFTDPDRAHAQAIGMEEQGADIIDLGAESTRPDAKRISVEEEWQRLAPVLKRLRGKLGIPLSLDTYKAEIAERALEYGVEILNDPSGLTFDADLAKVATNGNTGLILNHMRGRPETWAKLGPMPDVMGNICKDLEATVSRARRAGVEKNRIVVDPGLGFGKRREQNSEILAHLGRLAGLDYPVLVGPSRKSFLNHAGLLKGVDAENADSMVHATGAAVTAAILNGAHIVRVHDVKEMRTVAQVADEIARASIVPAKPEDAGERPAARPPRSQGPRFLGEERSVPTRPPLSRPEPVRKAPPEELRPAAAQGGNQPVRRPPQDKPSRGWTPPPRTFSKDRPPIGDSRSDSRSDPRKTPQDRPWRGRPESRPPQGKPPYRGSSPGRPPRGDAPRPPASRDTGDRPYRGPSPNRPPGGPRGDRPPRGDQRDRPARPPKGGPGRDAPPRRPFRKRP